jgi:uncharacterized protein
LDMLRKSGELNRTINMTVKPAQPGKQFLFPGEEEFAETVFGPCYLRKLRFPLAHFHGSGQLVEILNCRGVDLALPARDGSLAAVSPDRSLFLDIETTGLSGGTGTWVILIGLGWLEDNEFHLHQYFLRHPAEERSMLLHFSEIAAGFNTLVSFNGKAFDLPMIQTRQVLAGTPIRIEPNIHIDLLPCSRRLWKVRLASCSLRSLETELLGLQRYLDIPGEEIPAVYFNYLRHGDTVRLRQVFEHNVWDILSMVMLLSRVARTAAGGEPGHPADSFSLGKLCDESGRVAEATTYYQQVLCCGNERLEQMAMMRLSYLYKRQGMWGEAVALWNQLVQRYSHDLTPYVELAKYYEHRTGDCSAALALTEQALLRMQNRSAGPITVLALRHRQERLKRKLAIL